MLLCFYIEYYIITFGEYALELGYVFPRQCLLFPALNLCFILSSFSRNKQIPHSKRYSLKMPLNRSTLLYCVCFPTKADFTHSRFSGQFDSRTGQEGKHSQGEIAGNVSPREFK